MPTTVVRESRSLSRASLPVAEVLVRECPAEGEVSVKILILKEFDVIETVQCDHDPAAPPHTAYRVTAGVPEPDGLSFMVCSLDAVARPDVLEAPAPDDAPPSPPVVTP